jgi:hypothetical protein
LESLAVKRNTGDTMIIPKKTITERIKHSRFVSALKRPFKPLFQHRVEMALDIIDLQNQVYKLEQKLETVNPFQKEHLDIIDSRLEELENSDPVVEFREKLNRLQDKVDELDYWADEQERRLDNHDPFEGYDYYEWREIAQQIMEHVNIIIENEPIEIKARLEMK